ncbi:TonB-dependent receptor [Phenylobacterium sp. SCN 70-31]|uniref:TonB-dependent receptor n=1 Tax=Phenylobacterium sp. SCN 70-31 TaxID=1660129 RepID=UPI000869C087|nr:TonB-dependent receptor [Phenylobacterium sp. SCN 70-31]ODT87906.1 MAG: TonB-dependent receptor [Phenylobacterium sp. SCN 70-31]
MSRVQFFSAAALTALLAGSASAQSAANPAAGPPREVGEVVVTAAPYAVTLDSATTSVDILKREDIDQAPAGGIGDALAGVAGVRSSAFGPGASRPVIRGLSGPRVLVLSNGLGQVDASALSPDHAVASDPQEAERIEVLRGPSALAYGGSAIGGVVNIIDDRIPTRPVEGLSGRILGSGSSVDDGWSVGGALKAGAGPWVVTADGLRRETKDYKVPTFPESRRQFAAEGEADEWPGKVDSKVENTFSNLSAYGAGLSYVGERGYVGVSVKRTRSDYGVPGHAHAHGGHDHDGHDHDDHDHDDHDEGEEEAVSIKLRQTRYDLRGETRLGAGPFETLRFSVGYADYTHVELEDGTPATRFTSDGWESRIELVQPDRDGWQGAVGLQLLGRDFAAVGDEAYVPATRTKEWGAFTLQRFDRDAWGVEGGLRLERKEIDSLVADRDFTGVSASAGAFLRPAEGLFVSLSASRTERAPAQEELFAQGAHPATRSFEIGDPTLGSEVSYSVDLTGHVERGRFEVDAHLFAVRYDGFIDLRPTGAEDDDSGLPIFAYRQTDATFHGGEIDGSFRAWERGERSFTLQGTADYVRGRTDLGPPARIPPWSVAGRGIYEAGWWRGMIEVRRVGGQDRVAAAELPTSGYTLLNASLTVRPLRDRGFKIFLEGRNLGDVEAREHASFLKDIAPLPGRNFRLGVGYRF